MERIGTLELTNLMETYAGYSLSAKAQGLNDISLKHARRAIAYAAEIDRRTMAGV